MQQQGAYYDEGPLMPMKTRRTVGTWARAGLFVGVVVGLFVVATFGMVIDIETKLHRIDRVIRGADEGFETAAEHKNDDTGLQYVLTLENLEDAFYEYVVSEYTDADFLAAGYEPGTYAYFLLVADHEAAHVAALDVILESRGLVPVPRCTYLQNFGTASNITKVVDTARLLENTGVKAYNGITDRISSGTLRKFFARTATVEARHAGYLNQLAPVSQPPPEVPFPTRFDDALAPNDIVAAVLGSGLVLSCSYTLAGPELTTDV